MGRTRFWGGLWLALALIAGARGAPRGFVLEIMAANPAGGTAQLYYDIGRWYSGVDSCRVPMPASATLQPYRFPIPAEPIKRLRFDPADGAATLRVGRIRLLTAEGVELASFGPECLVPMHSIAALSWREGVARVVAGADDPMLSINRPLQAETERALGRGAVGPAGIMLGAIGGMILLGLALAAAMRSLGGLRWATLGAAGGVFLVVFGARLFWLHHYSRPMPYWDEWETDALDLLIPLRGGYLDWQALIIPQGEHRILFTRLLNLAGTICNGEWDPRVGMVAGAALFAASIALLFAASVPAGRIRRMAVGLGLMVWAGYPFDIENIYWGDQSQMYALNLLAVVGLTIAVAGRIDRGLLIGAVAAGLVSLFTMGSGLAAPAIAAVICLGRCRAEKSLRPRLWALGGCFLVMALGGALLYREAPFQGPGYARTLAQFWPAFVGRASWPFAPGWLGLALIWTPWLVLTGAMAFGRGSRSKLEWLAWGVGAWALANAAGLAHGRPLDVAPFNPKYFTAMSMTVAAGVLCAAALTVRWPLKYSGICIAAALASVGALMPIAWLGMNLSPGYLANRSRYDDLIRPFLATGNPEQLRATPYSQLPYWNGAELAEDLDAKDLLPVLPAVLRSAAALRPGSALRGPQTPGPLTVLSRILMKAGIGLFVAGFALFGWFAARRSPVTRV